MTLAGAGPGTLTKFQDTGDLLEGGLKGPAPYNGMADLDQMLQARKADEQRRQMLAQLLAASQQPQTAPQPVPSGGGVVFGPPVAEASPWTILSAGINGALDGWKKGQQQGQEPGGGGGGIVGGFGGGGMPPKLPSVGGGMKW